MNRAGRKEGQNRVLTARAALEAAERHRDRNRWSKGAEEAVLLAHRALHRAEQEEAAVAGQQVLSMEEE